MKWPKTHFQEFPHCNPHWKQPWCGVTGWTNFSAIFLFLLSFLHDLATIGTVAGVSDNFLIFWAALLSQTSKKKVSCEYGGFMLWIWYYAQIDRVLCHILLIKINPIWTSLFWFFKDSGGGGQICPHPIYMGVVGGRFQNWVGTSYLTEIDARQKDLWLSDT